MTDVSDQESNLASVEQDVYVPNALHPPGTIAVPCGEMGRFNSFSYSLACLQYPSGTRIAMAKGISIPRNLNSIMRERTGDWVWLIGDDHVFDPYLVYRLLDRLYADDLDALVPVCIRRQPPFATVLFKSQTDEGYQPFAYDELPDDGTLEIYACGTAGMLIRNRVLEDIGDPWFENADNEHATEDLEFCRKIRDAGYTIHADMNVLLGHIGLTTIWPKNQNGHWGFLFDFGDGPEGAMNQIFINVGEREARTRVG